MKKKEEIDLATEQEIFIDDLYEEKGVTAIKEIVGLVFPNIDEKFRDGRSVYGKAIKNYLASKGKKTKATSDKNGLGKWWTDFQKNDDSLRGSLIARMNEKNDADSSKIFGFYNELR